MSKMNLPLDIDFLEKILQLIDKKGNIILDMVSKNNHSTCHKRGKSATRRNGKAPMRAIEVFGNSICSDGQISCSKAIS